jgi:hypothetical protein
VAIAMNCDHKGMSNGPEHHILKLLVWKGALHFSESQNVEGRTDLRDTRCLRIVHSIGDLHGALLSGGKIC